MQPKVNIMLRDYNQLVGFEYSRSTENRHTFGDFVELFGKFVEKCNKNSNFMYFDRSIILWNNICTVFLFFFTHMISLFGKRSEFSIKFIRD